MIAEAAQQKSKKNNIKTPFNVKKAKAILEFRNKLNNTNTNVPGARSSSSSLTSFSSLYNELSYYKTSLK